MRAFLTTRKTIARIEDIIVNAKDRIVLISPFLYWPSILTDRLHEADRRQIQIVYIYGKAELQDSEREPLESLNNLSLYYCPELHAKCYFNEKELIISSLNMIDYSERNNWEMGIAVSKNEAIYREAVKEAQSIINASTLECGNPVDLIGEPKKNVVSTRYSSSHRNSSNGVCIRCSMSIEYNRSMPFCKECHNSWAQWENYEYEEKYCHKCGEEASTTISRPLCDSCFTFKVM